MLIFFVGYVETGKKKWGQKLAKELNHDFVDTRIIMEEISGLEYGQILNDKNLYIQLEQEALEYVLKLENTVVATSELLPCRYDNMDRLNEAGKTIFLRAGLGCIMMRISKLKNDIPLLKDIYPDVVPDFISMELNNRNPFYKKAQYNKLSREIKMKGLLEFVNS
jgi:shikimate kinase